MRIAAGLLKELTGLAMCAKTMQAITIFGQYIIPAMP
jgi:hypothetical protein